ncbi:Ig domain-containing protein [Salipiger bermudensis]|uniref:Ig domain-containing protein n=1 Tax=Salipiger bermudensis TaxID=344736 RepID=UPI001CD61C65|nr:Ig domain-containing protein [Salipiger bermudensis]MCA0964015.1 Ig domain-containing protein [Salipiger bermudensis]
MIDAQAAQRGLNRRLSYFCGETLRVRVSGLAPGQSVTVTVAEDYVQPPLIQRSAEGDVDLDPETLEVLEEGRRYVYNVWAGAGGCLSVLMQGEMVARRSVQPLTPPEPVEPAEPLVVTGVPQDAATVGVVYSFSPAVSGGTAPYSFALTTGQLPAGLLLDPLRGTIAGTPTQAETRSGLVLSVTDAEGATTSLAAFSISVTAAAVGLAAPPNLFTAAQARLDDVAHIDLQGNWEVANGRLRSPVTGGTAGQAARLSLAAPLTPGHSHLVRFDHEVAAGSLRARFAAPGLTASRQLTEPYMDHEVISAADMTEAATRLDLQPSTDYDGSVAAISAYDLSTVDPALVPCDVIIVGGDSNSANATSERFGDEIPMSARETAFDPRIWYMPCLRATGVYPTTDSVRHVPQPCIEPVAAVEARRMSPVHAVAGELVDWSAARRRPLLVMALGDPGSGLMNTEDWRKSSSVATTGGRMWSELLAMKAALDALGPAHEIVGMVWSQGANDLFGGDYSLSGQWMDQMRQFVSDLRADIADVPMVMWSVGQHYEPAPYDGRGAAMRAAQLRLDQDSGDGAWAIDRFRVVVPEAGNALAGPEDPHYTAHGMQQNGRDAGAALLAML